MQMIKNARTLGGVHTHTHTGNLEKGKIKYIKATQINL